MPHRKTISACHVSLHSLY